MIRENEINRIDRLFITGGTGFFGKSMLDYRLRHPEWKWADAEWVVLSRSPEKFIAEYPLLANQKGVSFIAGDIRDFTFPNGYFNAIIHAATSAINTLPDEGMESVIIDGTRHVINFAKTANCKTILFTSSGAVYGPRTSLVNEDDECNPTTAYGKGKLAAERLLLESGLAVKVARCFAFVGKYLNRNIQYAIGNFIKNCLDEKPIIINGDGTPLRSYLYADDLVEWLFTILVYGKNGRPYNVGSDEKISISELAERVQTVFNLNNKIHILQKPSNTFPSVYVPDVNRAYYELGLRKTVDLYNAIKMSI